jgi:hypothetical protein
MKDILLSQFALGIYVGCFLWAIAFYHLLKVKGENGRLKRKLSDKFEIEADTLSRLKQELDATKKENENLRVKVQTQNGSGTPKLERELEVFARAEKKMMVAAPGFAGSWEQAKQSAFQELNEEESGKAPPRRFFQRFFGGAVQSAQTTQNTQSEPVKALAEQSKS